ncbi:CPBP family intramembrane glutamic endopeptidase [Aquirufa ecclesiirivi]|uniref:CPBP family intramembrane glutamic endopeptidase n=1 Tax=Aquirufa ecclesiirivi TaxID=2715124 RepID=UPI003BAED1EA
MLKNKLYQWLEVYQGKPLYGPRLWFIIKYYFLPHLLLTGTITLYVERTLQHRIVSVFDEYKLDSFLFLHGVLIAPFFETWLSQWLIINVCQQLFSTFSERISGILSIGISSILFAAAHYFNDPYYPFLVFDSGIVLAMVYYFTKKEFDANKAFILTFLIHACWNLIPTTIHFIFL